MKTLNYSVRRTKGYRTGDPNNKSVTFYAVYPTRNGEFYPSIETFDTLKEAKSFCKILNEGIKE